MRYVHPNQSATKRSDGKIRCGHEAAENQTYELMTLSHPPSCDQGQVNQGDAQHVYRQLVPNHHRGGRNAAVDAP